MYCIHIQYNKQGNFEQTVYHPMEYQRAEALLKHLRCINGADHNYILVSAN